MKAYMSLVALNNYLISHVVYDELRNFSNYTTAVGKNYFRQLMFTLITLVEKAVSLDMFGTRRAIMYEAWTDGGVHYLGAFAVYMRHVKVMQRGTSGVKEELTIHSFG